MKKKLVYGFVTACFLMACQQPDKTSSGPATEKIKTKEDSLYHDVLALHDETMAKYGKLLGLEKKLQQKVDSIKLYIKKNNCYCESAHDALRNDSALVNDLKAAEKDMNDWMDQFNPDPKMKTTDERAAYFQDQKEKATLMKDGFFKALNKADSLLKK